jgi:hypothetical protein
MFDIYKYSWESHSSTGSPSGQSITLLPLLGFFFLLSFFGFNDYIKQALAYSLILFSSMLFTYLLVYKLFSYRPDKKVAAIASALFYTFNPLVMITYWYTGILVVYLLPSIPCLLLLFLLVLEKRKFTYILLMSVTLSFFSIIFLNPAFAISVILILVLYLTYQAYIYRKDRNKIKILLKYILNLIFLVFLINAWFVLPTIISISLLPETYQGAISAMDPLQTLTETSRAVNLLILFRFLTWKSGSPVWAYKNVTWRFCYDTPLFVFLSDLALLLITIPIIVLGKNDKKIIFFMIVLIAGLFLCNGLNPPFGYVFKFLFIHIPYFYSFRSLNKFVPFLLVSYSVLFGIGVSLLYSWIRDRVGIRYSKLMIAILLFLICGVYVFPMWTGAAINAPITIRANEISSFIEVPSYYQDIMKYFNRDPTSYRILSLPLRPWTYVRFNWTYGYDGPDMTYLLYNHETISCLSGSFQSSTKMLLKLENLSIGNLFYKLASLFAIKYIVIQNDVDISHGNYPRKLMSQYELKLLLRQLGTPYVRSFSRLDLYEIPSNYFLPRIYPSTKPILINGSINEMLQFIISSNYITGSNVIFLSNQTSIKQWQLLKNFHNGSVPQIIFKRVNPTKYIVEVKNATQPFFLVFSESYHPWWKAYAEDKLSGVGEIAANYGNIKVKEARSEMKFTPEDISYLFIKPLSDDNHFIANGYANAWYVDPKEIDRDGDGCFTITLYFLPQSLFYLGLLVSGATFAVCTIYLILRSNIMKKIYVECIRLLRHE